jgi:hypothetical protein
MTQPHHYLARKGAYDVVLALPVLAQAHDINTERMGGRRRRALLGLAGGASGQERRTGTAAGIRTSCFNTIYVSRPFRRYSAYFKPRLAPRIVRFGFALPLSKSPERI